MKGKNVKKNLLIQPQEETKDRYNVLEESIRDQTEKPEVLKPENSPI